MKKSLINKINNREVTVGVIGLGYVGLPLVLRFSEVGFKTIGFDIDKEKVNDLNKGNTYFKHIYSQDVKAAVKCGFTATADFSKISISDILIICVPTPLGPHNEPDLSFVKNTLSSIKPYLIENQVLILESTTYPGTTEQEIVPEIEDIGFEIGKNFFIPFI